MPGLSKALISRLPVLSPQAVALVLERARLGGLRGEFAALMAATAQVGGCTVDDLRSPARDRNLAWLRAGLWWCGRHATGRSQSDMAARTGGRHHATVLVAVGKCEADLAVGRVEPGSRPWLAAQILLAAGLVPVPDPAPERVAVSVTGPHTITLRRALCALGAAHFQQEPAA